VYCNSEKQDVVDLAAAELASIGPDYVGMQHFEFRVKGMPWKRVSYDELQYAKQALALAKDAIDVWALKAAIEELGARAKLLTEKSKDKYLDKSFTANVAVIVLHSLREEYGKEWGQFTYSDLDELSKALEKIGYKQREKHVKNKCYKYDKGELECSEKDYQYAIEKLRKLKSYPKAIERVQKNYENFTSQKTLQKDCNS
jgi:hypothetical protein